MLYRTICSLANCEESKIQIISPGGIEIETQGYPIVSTFVNPSVGDKPISIILVNNYGHIFMSHTLPSSNLERHIESGMDYVETIPNQCQFPDEDVMVSNEPIIAGMVVGANPKMMKDAIDILKEGYNLDTIRRIKIANKFPWKFFLGVYRGVEDINPRVLISEKTPTQVDWSYYDTLGFKFN